MSEKEVLEKILQSFEVYYDVSKANVTIPFAAEAEFYSCNEQYFLMKSAKLSEAESAEHVFFYTTEYLNKDILQSIDKTAWDKGLAGIKVSSSHRNSDVTLVIIAGQIDPDARSVIPKMKHYKSYRFGLQGWSNYRLIAFECSSKQVTCNHQGKSLKKLFSNI